MINYFRLDFVIHKFYTKFSRCYLARMSHFLAGYLFGELMHLIKEIFKVVLKNAYVIVVAGGLIVIGLVFLIGNGD